MGHLALPHSTKNFAAFYFFVNISSKCLTQGMEDHQITGIKDKTNQCQVHGQVDFRPTNKEAQTCQ